MNSATGRTETRSRMVVPIEWWTADPAFRSANSVTENVSAHGARIVIDQGLRPSSDLFVARSGTVKSLEARVVYCRRAGGGLFRVGLQFRENIWDHWTHTKEAETPHGGRAW